MCLVSDYLMVMAQQVTTTLYRNLLKEASKFPDFNFKSYFIRKINESFFQGNELRKSEEIQYSLQRSGITIEMLQRQATIGQLYDSKRIMPFEGDKM